MTELEDLRRKPWENLEFSDPAANIRSMITLGEKRLVYWLASEWFQGLGEIVDLGCYVGAETIVFAEGLRQNERRQQMAQRPLIHAFDNFEKVEGGDPNFLVETPLLQEFAINLHAHRKDVCVYAGDITGYAWPPVRPIEILFNDVSKSPEINAFVIKEFFPRLVPGKSVLIQQDYYDDHYWVPVSMEKLAEYFEVIAGPIGGTRAYLCTKPITDTVLAEAGRIDLFADIELMKRVISSYGGWYSDLFKIAAARMMVSAKRLDEARHIHDEVNARYPDHRVLQRRLARLKAGIDRAAAERSK